MKQLLTPAILLGVIALALATTGVGLMSTAPPEYLMARVCFGTAWFLTTAYLYWLVTVGGTTGTEVFFTCLAVTGVSVLWMAADRWVVVKQANDPDVKRRRQRETLTGYVIEGMRVREIYKSLEVIPKAEAEEWSKKVATYLKENLGHEYAVQFISPPNRTQLLWNTCPPDMSQENYRITLVVNMRLTQLDTIIKSLMG